MINLWKFRGFFLFGKVIMIKFFLILKLLYVFLIIEILFEIIKQMEKMIYKFLWKGFDKVIRFFVINILENGGLNFIDFELYIKVLRLFWILCFIDEKEGFWIFYFKYNLKKYGGCFFFRCNYDVNDFDLSFSKFYLQFLRWWVDFRCFFFDVNYF